MSQVRANAVSLVRLPSPLFSSNFLVLIFICSLERIEFVFCFAKMWRSLPRLRATIRTFSHLRVVPALRAGHAMRRFASEQSTTRQPAASAAGPDKLLASKISLLFVQSGVDAAVAYFQELLAESATPQEKSDLGVHVMKSLASLHQYILVWKSFTAIESAGAPIQVRLPKRPLRSSILSQSFTLI